MTGPGDTRPLIGRDDLQCQLTSRLGLDGSEAGLTTTVLTGVAGIGKTALWDWAVQSAQTAGWRVLIARCAAAETALPWVGLTDLLSGCDDRLVGKLPAPQRHALAVATLRADPVGPPPDERSVGTAVAGLLTDLAESGPVLLAIDDVAALDPTTKRALRFALRRGPERLPLRVLATTRDEAWGVIDEFPGPPATLTVGPMSVAALFQVLRQHLGLTFGRPTLVRIHETSQGNPLYALELARALERREIHDVPGRPLALPDTLQDLLADRLERTRADVRQLVAAAAATWRLLATDVESGALAQARADGLVTVHGGLVVPAHPLLGSAAYAVLSEDDRMSLHHRLSRTAADPIERARHLAIATPTPAPDVALVLDDAAAQAAARGAVEAAAELVRLAVPHTPLGSPEAVLRRERLADLLLQGGDAAAAEAAQREAVAACPGGPERARPLIRLAGILVETTSWNAAVPVLEQAVAAAGQDAVIAAEAYLTLSAVIYDDIKLSHRHAARAVQLLDSAVDPDPVVLSGALSQAAGARFRAGYGLDHEMEQRAIELEREHPGRRLSDRADAGYAALLKYADDLTASAAMFEDLLTEAEASGDVSSIAYILSHLPQLELWRGDFAAARRYADGHRSLAESAELASQIDQAHYITGLVAAHEGNVAQSRRLLEEDLALRDPDGDLWERHRTHGALGFLAWSEGDTARAAAHLDTWNELLRTIGMDEPGYSRFHRDHVEVLVATGRLTEAERFLDRLAGQAEQADRTSARAVVATGRGLLSAARGNDDAAQEHMAVALDIHATIPLRFDRARTLWAAGQVHRRAKAKLLAREAFSQARAEFAVMGARLWIVRTDAELARVNIRPGASAELTETERRVAELVARGMTNRQVADAMFVSPKTVEANLSRIYRKLGVGSRAQLGARFGGTQGG
jgi:DNA-binding CsgD family transcriptional regulator